MANNNPVVFTCDLNGSGKTFPHFWEHCVGSCHATMALRADWQQQLKKCHDELGFKYVRFHGWLGDDMGTLMDEMGQPVYSFFNADQICDYLLSIGMRPFVELSFMPTTLASGDDIVFHYKGNITPPKDINTWNTLIRKLVTHWVERYGIEEVKQWFFEVWNEPNLSAFWTGTQAQYFDFYKNTAETIKQVHKELQVGGPATSDNQWVADFIDYCEAQRAPFDFISTHQYPTDSFGQPGDDTVAQLAASERSALRKEAAGVKEIAKDYPVYYTEWCTSSNPFDEMHDMPYASAFIVKTVMEAQGLVQGYSYWTFSDIFEENYFSSLPFHGGFGLMNIYGIPKPAYRAFELLHQIGDEQLATEGTNETVDVWALKKGNKYQILLTNWALPRHSIRTETVTLVLKNARGINNVKVAYIDDSHGNAHQAWKDMGSPDSLMPKQVADLLQISQLDATPLAPRIDNDNTTLEIIIKEQAVACITFEIV